ncbi:MAG: hypothetical protein Q4G68_06830 [Planctomycetia bacterium]|nr:hypothetical protein [Planctomycetia bacterium]
MNKCFAILIYLLLVLTGKDYLDIYSYGKETDKRVTDRSLETDTSERIFYVDCDLLNENSIQIPNDAHLGKTLALYRNKITSFIYQGHKLNLSPQEFKAVLTAPNLKRFAVHMTDEGDGLTPLLRAEYFQDVEPLTSLQTLRLTGGIVSCDLLRVIMNHCPSLEHLSLDVAVDPNDCENNDSLTCNSIEIPPGITLWPLEIGDTILFNNSLATFSPSDSIGSLIAGEYSTKIKPFNCQNLERFPNLKAILLYNAFIDHASLQSAINNLSTLSLNNCRIQTSGSLSSVTSPLSFLRLKHCMFDSSLLNSLLALSELQVVNLSYSHLGTNPLLPLATTASSKLEGIFLSHTSITDADIVHLVELKKLLLVDLSFTAVTDNCVEHLLKNKSLTYVLCNGCNISTEGVQRLIQNGKIVLRHDSEIGAAIGTSLKEFNRNKSAPHIPLYISGELFDDLEDKFNIFSEDGQPFENQEPEKGNRTSMIFHVLINIFLAVGIVYTSYIMLITLKRVSKNNRISSISLIVTTILCYLFLFPIRWRFRTPQTFTETIVVITFPWVFSLYISIIVYGYKHPKYGIKIFASKKCNKKDMEVWVYLGLLCLFMIIMVIMYYIIFVFLCI